MRARQGVRYEAVAYPRSHRLHLYGRIVWEPTGLRNCNEAGVRLTCIRIGGLKMKNLASGTARQFPNLLDVIAADRDESKSIGEA